MIIAELGELLGSSHHRGHGEAHYSRRWTPDGTYPGGVRRATRLRAVVNVVNLSTPLGALVAVIGGARLRRGPDGLLLAENFRGKFLAPRAPAVTIGNVILLRMDADAARNTPGLLAHESRHSSQYACWLGPFGFLPAYLLASLWSWWLTGTFALRNRFEVRAGLVDGGYVRKD